MDFELRAWYLFGGAVLFFMGLGLALDAESRARLAAQWPGASSEPKGDAGRLVWSYRAGGLALCGAGLYGVASVLWFPANVARSGRFALSPAAHVGAGALLVLTGLSIGWVKIAEAALRGRGYAFLEGEGSAAAPPRSAARRLAAVSGWLVALSFIAFGTLLLSRTPRGGAPHDQSP